MNRRNFLGLLAGGLAASAAAIITFKRREADNWNGLRLDPYPGRLAAPTLHSFQNDGASSGVCKVCGDSVTTHDSVVLKNGDIVCWREFTPDPSQGALPLGSA